jgi:hypothetical protein
LAELGLGRSARHSVHSDAGRPVPFIPDPNEKVAVHGGADHRDPTQNQDSLIRVENSLIARFNSLLRPQKIPCSDAQGISS